MKKIILSLFLLFTFLAHAGEVVNINTADKDTLMLVKGIGEKRAEAIIRYREKNGPFKSLQHLLEIRGVGQSFIEKNRSKLTVSSAE